MIIPLLLALAIIIIAAKLGGWLANLIGQPTVLGKLLVGLVLGPSFFNLFGSSYFEHGENLHEVLHVLGEIGVIFLMFVAGLETDLTEMRKSGVAATVAGSLGVVVPLVLGTLVCLAFGYNWIQSIFIGVVLTATSVSISAQTLIELGKLRSKEGLTILGAAVVDDVLGIAVLSAFVAVALGGGGGVTDILFTVARMLVFLVAAALLGYWLAPRVINLAKRLPVSAPGTAAVIVMVLLFAWASEAVGSVAAITGAYVLGAALSGSSLKHEVDEGIHNLTYAFLVPIFLVNIGLTADARALSSNAILLTVAVCIVAVVSKVFGCGLGAKLSGLNWEESLKVGIGMISRGEVGLIVAGVGVTRGVIGNNEFTIAVVMVLVSTLVTPPLLRWAFSRGALAQSLSPASIAK
jgi:Kef-type K+ transport system membrane component KefB